jgi:MATE family multidrug resistance protein
MWATILGNIVNVVLNYLFIYGWIFQSWDCWRIGTIASRFVMLGYMHYDAKGKVSAFFREVFSNIKRSHYYYSIRAPSAMQMFF